MKICLHHCLLSATLITGAVGTGKSQTLNWAVGFGSTGLDMISDIKPDANRNIYLAGFFNGTVDFDPGAGVHNLTSAGYDGFVLKLDSSGQFLWAQQIHELKVASGLSLAVDKHNNVLIGGSLMDTMDVDPGAGTFTLLGNPNGLGFVLKLNKTGNFVWARQLDGNDGSAIRAIDTDNNANVFTAGWFKDTVDFDPGVDTTNIVSAGQADAFVQKLDSNGVYAWVRQIGGSMNDVATCLDIDAAGKVYFGGNFAGTVDINPEGPFVPLASLGATDIFIEKLENNGMYSWYRQIGGAGVDEINDIAETGGNFFYTGSFTDMCDFDPHPGGFYDIVSEGGKDAYLSLLDAGANFVWTQPLPGSGDAEGTHLSVDANGKIYLMGLFGDSTDFDPGTNELFMIAGGLRDIFVERFDELGNMEWARQLGSIGAEGAGGLYASNEGDLYLAGDYENMLDADPTFSTVNLVSEGAQDVFALRWNQNGVGIAENENAGTFIVYPNPMNDVLNISLNENTRGAKLSVVNAAGQVVFEQYLTGNKTTLSFDGPAGIYIVMITDGDNFSSTKVIKKK